MTVTREQLLLQVHEPLQTTAQPSSPTKSTCRVRWRQVSEWTEFVSDARTYWNGLPDAEKNAVLVGLADNYWDVVADQLAELAPIVSREPHLSTPFSLLYAAPHNKATNGATDSHAKITANIPDANLVGQPDSCFLFNGALAGIVEIKSFWNLTQAAILDVLQGLSILL